MRLVPAYAGVLLLLACADASLPGPGTLSNGMDSGIPSAGNSGSSSAGRAAVPRPDARVVDAESDSDASNPAASDAGLDAASPMHASTDAAVDASTDAVTPLYPLPDPACTPSADTDADAGVDHVGLDEDAGSSDGVRLTVPENGGRVVYCTPLGSTLTFDFPYSAGGLQITATALDPLQEDWPHAEIAPAVIEAIRLEPTDTVFDVPVAIRLPSAALHAFVFGPSSSVPTPLRFPDAHRTLQLTHLGTLAILSPQYACDSAASSSASHGWGEEPNSGMCSGFGPKSTWRYRTCEALPFCYAMSAGCCVYPGAPGFDCRTDDAFLSLFNRRLTATDDTAYCAAQGDTAYIQSVSPAMLRANYVTQTITLTGNGFARPGEVGVGQGVGISIGSQVQTTWVSATTVTAEINGLILAPGVDSVEVAYLNGDPNTYDTWDFMSNHVVVPVEPAVACPVPGEGGGACEPDSNGCTCSVEFDPGSGPHTYAMRCDAAHCECTRDGTVITSSTRFGAGVVCRDMASMRWRWKELCRPTPDFCP